MKEIIKQIEALEQSIKTAKREECLSRFISLKADAEKEIERLNKLLELENDPIEMPEDADRS